MFWENVWEKMLCILNDILIYLKTLFKHVEHVKSVLITLWKEL